MYRRRICPRGAPHHHGSAGRRRLASFLALAVALSALLACLGGTSAAAGRTRHANRVTYGLDLNYHDGNIGPARLPQALAEIGRAGARIVRTGASWSELEPLPGVYRWALLDRLLALVRKDHLRVLLELGSTPTWDLRAGVSARSRQVNYPPRDCNAAGRCLSVSLFVAALIDHLHKVGDSPLVAGLIPANEPQNFNKNWVGGAAAQYSLFQRAVFQAVAGRLPVLNGGTEILPSKLQRILVRYAKHPAYIRQSYGFAQQLYASARWCRSISILDVHVGDHGPAFSRQIVDLSERAIERCDGGRRLPVWVTEVGYPYLTSVQRQPELRAELGRAYLHGPVSQVAYLRDTLRALAADRTVTGIDWTFLVSPTDQPGLDGAGLGLLDPSWQPEPSLRAFEAIAAHAGRPASPAPARAG